MSSSGLWERLVDQEMRLHEIVPGAHEAPVEVLRRLVGAPDNVAFRLPGPLARRVELGQHPPATQLALDTATARAEAD